MFLGCENAHETYRLNVLYIGTAGEKVDEVVMLRR